MIIAKFCGIFNKLYSACMCWCGAFERKWEPSAVFAECYRAYSLTFERLFIIMLVWWNGRRVGLKIRCWWQHVGSSPTTGTKLDPVEPIRVWLGFSFYFFMCYYNDFKVRRFYAQPFSIVNLSYFFCLSRLAVVAQDSENINFIAKISKHLS